MIRSVRDLLHQLAIRPVFLAGFVGGVLAWPVASGPWWTPWSAVALLAAIATALADLGKPPPGTWARALSSLGLSTMLLLALGQRLDEPAFGLVAMVAYVWTLRHVWRKPAGSPSAPPRSGATADDKPSGAVLLALAVASVPATLPVPRLVLLFILATSGAAVLSHQPKRPTGRSALDALLESPARLLVVSFAAIATVGSLLLVLPWSSTTPGSIRLLDAVFTSVSATCVTGLIVLDTPHDFTLFGQAAILGLIQLGGLGIMTFAAAGAVFLGRRLGVRQEAMTADLMGGESARRDLERTLRTVLRVTFWTEAGGALVLTPLFVLHGDGVATAAWRGLFTAISAFCNAGFALQTDSLVPYQGSPGVLLTISVLIVIGGLGPLVVAAAPLLRRGRGSLHAKLVASTTAVLLSVPMVLFLALEWNSTLAELSFVDKIVNAWFQSVTLRTAGFNSIDFAAIQPATWTLSILCMFVGGSPGSTAGGAKTTTVTILLLAVVAAIRGRAEAAAFGRRIPHRTVYEAAAITTVGVLSAAAALVALQVTQVIPLDHGLFEVVSALGTVGLSMGATGALDDVGKVLVIVCMFAGRVGPLTLFIFLVGRARAGRRFPLEGVQVG